MECKLRKNKKILELIFAQQPITLKYMDQYVHVSSAC